MHRSRIVLGALVLGCILAAAASATTILPVDATDAVDRAELIFRGEVVAIETVTSRDGSFPFTFVTFAVHDALKGAAAGKELTLRFHGGDLAATQETVEVVGMPSFERGDEVVLFVDGNGRLACPLVGWWQGKLDVVRHPRTGEPMLVDHRGAPIESVDESGWSYADLRYDAEAEALVAREPGAELLWQDGVEIVDDSPIERAAGDAIVAADAVLDALRQLIDRRALQKSAVAAAPVQSASPADVPDTVEFRAVAPSR